MHLDAIDLKDFYACPLGLVVRKLLGAAHQGALRRPQDPAAPSGSASPPPISPCSGARPSLCGALMPARARRHCLAGEGPVFERAGRRDRAAADRRERRPASCSCICWNGRRNPRELLREMWRVLAPNGRLLIVVPNRRGLWARVDTTPFGYGSPFSRSQLTKPAQGRHVLAGGMGLRALYAALQLAHPAANGRCSGSASGSCCGRPSPA